MGTVTVTSAGQLNSFKNIVHVVCPQIKKAGKATQLQEALKNCLQKAVDSGCKTIATVIAVEGKAVFKAFIYSQKTVSFVS